jgi:hypothetical protein
VTGVLGEDEWLCTSNEGGVFRSTGVRGNLNETYKPASPGSLLSQATTMLKMDKPKPMVRSTLRSCTFLTSNVRRLHAQRDGYRQRNDDHQHPQGRSRGPHLSLAARHACSLCLRVRDPPRVVACFQPEVDQRQARPIRQVATLAGL